MRWIGGLFLIAHGLLHIAVWVPPSPANVPFDTSRSPIFGNVHGIAISPFCTGGAAFRSRLDRCADTSCMVADRGHSSSSYFRALDPADVLPLALGWAGDRCHRLVLALLARR